MQEYTIKEALEELNISRATLYNRLKLSSKKLKEHITIKDGKKYISQIGIEILKDNTSIDENDVNKSSEDINNRNFEFDLLKENEFLKSQIEFLQSQMLMKDDQIKTLFTLVENSQVLLKNEQQTRLLESVEHETKKSFFNWFKKNPKNNKE